MLWTSSSGRINLSITKNQAERCSHPGQCDDDILWLSKEPKIARQVRHIDPETLKAELKEFGAWSDDELEHHEQNIQRILWIACGDIADGNI